MNRFILILVCTLLACAAFAGEIHDAAAKGDLARVRAIVTADPGQVNARDDNLYTPLHHAAYNGFYDLSLYLIENGAEVNAEHVRKSIPLHGAAYYNHPDIVMLLLDHGARINQQNEAGYAPLLSATAAGNTEVVNLLIESGADLTRTTTNGMNSLHLAAIPVPDGEPELVRMLLDRGLDPNSPAENGTTPVFFAALGGSPANIDLLIEHGARVNVVDSQGNTPLHYAIRDGKTDAARALIRAGADPDVASDEGFTPLYLAVTEGNDDILTLLLDAGADRNALDMRYGRTPLHWAAIQGNLEQTTLLAESGVDLNAKDSKGRTAVQYACCYGHPKVVQLLTELGAIRPEGARVNDAGEMLCRKMKKGEAAFWYLGHCGWAVKTRNHFLVFDYWNPGKEPCTPCLANGHIDPEELKDLQVTVFVTHDHRDHFDPAIFTWADKVENIQYIYGFDPAESTWGSEPYNGPEYTTMPPHATRKYLGNDLVVRTIESNDAGVGYVVTADNVTVYHAGDHAGWAEGERETYMREIDYIAQSVKRVDVAMLNATGCHTHDPAALKEGTIYTVEHLKPKVVIPTHAGRREFVYQQVADDYMNQLSTTLFLPENRGDHFVYRKGKVTSFE